MKVKNAAKHYKSKAEIARKLGLERSTVTKWGEIVPLKYAWELTINHMAVLLSGWLTTE